MPEVEEVFRLATNKVKPDPDALERQVRRQRASARTSRAWAYAAVAAVVVLAAIGAVVFAGTRPDVSPGDQSTGQTIPPSVASLAPGATPQSTEIFSIDGHSVATIQGLPLDARGLTVSADGSTIAFVTTPEGSSTNQVATIHADGTGLMVLFKFLCLEHDDPVPEPNGNSKPPDVDVTLIDGRRIGIEVKELVCQEMRELFGQRRKAERKLSVSQLQTYQLEIKGKHSVKTPGQAAAR